MRRSRLPTSSKEAGKAKARRSRPKTKPQGRGGLPPGKREPVDPGSSPPKARLKPKGKVRGKPRRSARELARYGR